MWIAGGDAPRTERTSDATASRLPGLLLSVRTLGGAVEPLALFLVLAVAILLTVEPWPSFFATGIPDHWDARIMGQWLAWNAANILDGRVLLPDFNANFFYPHSHTLAFGDAFWTPSFVYAAIQLVSQNHFLSFNGTILFFWALSGVTMFALLRELSLGRGASYLGAALFCLVPFRLAYYYLFTGTLVFVLPLLLLLLLRWLRRPGYGRALLLCAGFWVSLTSNINYTVIAFLPLVLLALGWVAYRPAILRDPRALGSGLLMVAVTAGLAALYLYPYLTLRAEIDFSRELSDHLEHYTEVFHYISTRHSLLLGGLFDPDYRPVETMLFPGTALAALTVAYFAAGSARTLVAAPGTPWPRTAFLVTKFVLWTVFWCAFLAAWHFRDAPWVESLGSVIVPVSVALAAWYVISLLWPPRDSERRVIVNAMAAGAVASFFLTLGPQLTIAWGSDTGLLRFGSAPLAPVLAHFPLFESIRALARFGAMVQLYLVIGACLVVDLLLRRYRIALPVCLALLALLVWEGRWMQPHMRHRYVDFTDMMASPVMEQARSHGSNAVLLQLPAGATFRLDTDLVLQSVRGFPFIVNAHSGFWPDFYYQVADWARKWDIGPLTAWLRELWPRPYLVLDRHGVALIEISWHQPFPWDELEEHWALLARDERYALYRLRAEVETATTITRRLRSDVLAANRRLALEARLPAAATAEGGYTLEVLLNGEAVASAPISDRWRHYEFVLPREWQHRLEGDEVELRPARGTDDAAVPQPIAARNLHFGPPR